MHPYEFGAFSFRPAHAGWHERACMRATDRYMILLLEGLLFAGAVRVMEISMLDTTMTNVNCGSCRISLPVCDGICLPSVIGQVLWFFCFSCAGFSATVWMGTFPQDMLRLMMFHLEAPTQPTSILEIWADGFDRGHGLLGTSHPKIVCWSGFGFPQTGNACCDAEVHRRSRFGICAFSSDKFT